MSQTFKHSTLTIDPSCAFCRLRMCTLRDSELSWLQWSYGMHTLQLLHAVYAALQFTKKYLNELIECTDCNVLSARWCRAGLPARPSMHTSNWTMYRYFLDLCCRNLATAVHHFFEPMTKFDGSIWELGVEYEYYLWCQIINQYIEQFTRWWQFDYEEICTAVPGI